MLNGFIGVIDILKSKFHCLLNELKRIVDDYVFKNNGTYGRLRAFNASC